MTKNNFPDTHDYTGLYLFNRTSGNIPVRQSDLEKIVRCIEIHDGGQFRLIELVYVDEPTIISINQEHLGHNYATDIITFPYDTNSSDQHIESTIYCCASHIRAQASEHDQAEETEFQRIIIHGLLHLLGYDDHAEADRHKMRNREDFYLQKLQNTPEQ